MDLFAEVKTVEQVREAVNRARERQGLIAYTLVDSELRNEIVFLANEAGIVTVDLIGPLMTALGTFLTAEPAHLPGLFAQAGDEHYQRLEAVSFTVRHDDGLSSHDAHLADIVLVGPSRTSKTPLSVYLAHTRGLKVANIPLVLGLPPLEELNKLGNRQVVGLTMRANVLSQVRRQRVQEMGEAPGEYAELSYVERELKFCHEIYRSPPIWPVVDVTGKSIEEIASEICALTVDAPDYCKQR
jgi:regulator of PEP synthase PpsR (kinase-PPPase family)